MGATTTGCRARIVTRRDLDPVGSGQCAVWAVHFFFPDINQSSGTPKNWKRQQNKNHCKMAAAFSAVSAAKRTRSSNARDEDALEDKHSALPEPKDIIFEVELGLLGLNGWVLLFAAHGFHIFYRMKAERCSQGLFLIRIFTQTLAEPQNDFEQGNYIFHQRRGLNHHSRFHTSERSKIDWANQRFSKWYTQNLDQHYTESIDSRQLFRYCTSCNMIIRGNWFFFPTQGAGSLYATPRSMKPVSRWLRPRRMASKRTSWRCKCCRRGTFQGRHSVELAAAVARRLHRCRAHRRHRRHNRYRHDQRRDLTRCWAVIWSISARTEHESRRHMRPQT